MASATQNADEFPLGASDSIGADSAKGNRGGELRFVFRRYRWRILLTYFLFNIENLLRLAQPLLLGWAINDLLASSYGGLILFAVGHTAHMLMRMLRQMYDTRTFTRIYADRAEQLVTEQRKGGVDVSRVAARTTLSREFVDFFERHVPLLIRALYSIVGALIMLVLFDRGVVLLCFGLIVPSCILNFVYGRRTLQLSGLLHDDLEKEVKVVERAEKEDVRNHFGRVSRWRVKLSDWEAITAGLMEIFVLALMVGALVRYCTLPGVAAGDIFAVFRYVMMFIMALDSVPMLVEQVSRLRDIGKRI